MNNQDNGVSPSDEVAEIVEEKQQISAGGLIALIAGIFGIIVSLSGWFTVIDANYAGLLFSFFVVILGTIITIMTITISSNTSTRIAATLLIIGAIVGTGVGAVVVSGAFAMFMGLAIIGGLISLFETVKI